MGLLDETLSRPLARRRAGGVAALLAALAAGPVTALETDQYLSWRQPLADSAPAVNAFINRRFEAALARINRANPERLTCEELPPRLYRSLFQGTGRRVLCPVCSSPIRSFLESDPAVDRFPPDGTGQGDYRRMSIFRDPAFPFILPLASTVRIGDVYLGADKSGHMFGFGGRYYRRYRRALESGASAEEATRRAVRWGLNLERYLVGGLTDGIFSHADLEANYQGLMLARHLCEARPPHLQLTDAGWQLARPVDIRRFVTPHLDESYNNPHFSRYRWKRIQRIFEREYCPLYRTAEVQRRRERYARRAQSNPSLEMIAAYFAAREMDRQAEHSVAAVCGEPVAAARSTR